MTIRRLLLLFVVVMSFIAHCSVAHAQFKIDAYITAPVGTGPLKATCSIQQYANSGLLAYDPYVLPPSSQYEYAGQSVYNCELFGTNGLEDTCTNQTYLNNGEANEAECTIVLNNPTGGEYQVFGQLVAIPWYDSDEYLCGSDSPNVDPLGFEDAPIMTWPGQPDVWGTGQFNCTALSSLVADSQETWTYVPPPITVTVAPSSVSLNQNGTQEFNATVNNASNTEVTWSISPSGVGTISSSGFYTAPATITTQQTVTIKATSEQDTTKSGTATVTLNAPPLTLISISPATWPAGNSNYPITITGSGFNSSTQMTITSPSWVANPTLSFTPTATPTNTTIQGTVNIPANSFNTTAQSIGITVSATINGVDSTTAPYTVTIAPVNYTYAVSFSSTATQLTYGSTDTIVPIITCRTGSGVACASGVANPQTANFSIINGVGAGSLSNTRATSSTVLTASGMVSSPQTVTVQGCATVQATTCATTTANVQATTLALNPSTVSNPLTGGKQQGFSAGVQNPGIANQLAWKLTATPSGAAMGTLASASSAIAGTPTSGTSSNTYTAPSPITTPTTVSLNVCVTANTNICATPVSITLQPPSAFAVTATPNGSTALSLGHSISYAVNVSPLYGFTGPVALSVSGLPAGVTGQLSTPSITTSGSATLTLTSAYSTSTYIGHPLWSSPERAAA